MRARWVAVVAAAVVATVTVVGDPAGAAAGTAAQPQFRVERVWNPNVTDWEPTVAADPSSHYVYQMTTRYGGKVVCGQYPYLKHCIVFRASNDGGRTWGPDHVMCPPCDNVGFQNDPQVKVAADGTIYAAWMNNWRVVFSKSFDHGATWTPPINLQRPVGAFTDKPILTISPSGRDVYVAFNSSDSYVRASHDYGATFADPVRTNDDRRYWFAEGGAVAPDGTVYLAESAEHQSATGSVQLWLLRSSDGGASWQQTLVATSRQQPACPEAGCPPDFYGSQMNVAVDSAGTVMVEYAANDAAGAPLTMQTSTTTDGVHFTNPVEVSAGAYLVGANFPAIAAGTVPGDFRIAFQDDRNGYRAWNTWYRQTADGGQTWSPALRLSDVNGGTVYKGPHGYFFPDGDYFGMAVDSSGTTFVVWGESPNYNRSGGTWFTRD